MPAAAWARIHASGERSHHRAGCATVDRPVGRTLANVQDDSRWAPPVTSFGGCLGLKRKNDRGGRRRDIKASVRRCTMRRLPSPCGVAKAKSGCLRVGYDDAERSSRRVRVGAQRFLRIVRPVTKQAGPRPSLRPCSASRSSPTRSLVVTMAAIHERMPPVWRTSSAASPARAVRHAPRPARPRAREERVGLIRGRVTQSNKVPGTDSGTGVRRLAARRSPLAVRDERIGQPVPDVSRSRGPCPLMHLSSGGAGAAS